MCCQVFPAITVRLALIRLNWLELIVMLPPPQLGRPHPHNELVTATAAPKARPVATPAATP